MIDLTTGKESKRIFYFALPMLLGNVFQQLYNIVDSIIIGKFIGKEALAAVGSSFPLIFVLISLIIGTASGSTIIISQYFGAKDTKNVQRTFETMSIFLFIAAILISIIGVSISGFILELLKVPADVLPQAKIYLHIYLGGIIMFFGFNGISAVLRGLGDSKTPLYFLIGATLTNIFLDLLFVVVFHWGIKGVAIATIISQGLAFVSATIYINRTHTVIHLFFKNLTFDKKIFSKSMSIGLPQGFQHTFVSLGMLALLQIVNDYGTNAIAAYTVAGRIDMIAAMPAMNFGMALSTFVGQNIGAKKLERVKKGFKATLLMTSVIAISTAIIINLFSKTIMGFFTNDVEVIRIGVEYLGIVSFFYLIFALMFVSNGVMRGAGDTFIPMLITLFSLWVIRVPASYFLSQHFGEIGIWWGIPTGWCFGAGFSYIYYLTGRWKRKVVI